MKKLHLLWWSLALVAVAVLPGLASGEGKIDPTAAPPLHIAEWVKGEEVTLEKGKIYVVEFWATWCPPCRVTIPHLSKLQEKYQDKDVVIVGISPEDAETVKPFVEKMGDRMSYRVAIDKNTATHKAYNKVAPIPGIPHAYIVDKESRVVWSGHPMGELETVLEELVAGKQPAETPAGEAPKA
jgi:thiol-disulfide isomerase/thioredoxin